MIAIVAIGLLAGSFFLGRGTAPDRKAAVAPAAVVLNAPVVPETSSIIGQVKLTDSAGGWTTGSSCEGSDGFSDISPGASITLYDAVGTVVNSTSISAGHAESSTVCNLGFSFPAMALPSTFYSIEVSHRGRVTYSIAELKGNSYTFALKIGS